MPFDFFFEKWEERKISPKIQYFLKLPSKDILNLLLSRSSVILDECWTNPSNQLNSLFQGFLTIWERCNISDFQSSDSEVLYQQ